MAFHNSLLDVTIGSLPQLPHHYALKVWPTWNNNSNKGTNIESTVTPSQKQLLLSQRQTLAQNSLMLRTQNIISEKTKFHPTCLLEIPMCCQHDSSSLQCFNKFIHSFLQQSASQWTGFQNTLKCCFLFLKATNFFPSNSLYCLSHMIDPQTTKQLSNRLSIFHGNWKIFTRVNLINFLPRCNSHLAIVV